MGESPEAGHPVLVAFGHRVRERRRRLGLTLDGLAGRSGFHMSYLSQLERGRRNASILSVTTLARALEVEPGEFFKGLTSTPQPG